MIGPFGYDTADRRYGSICRGELVEFPFRFTDEDVEVAVFGHVETNYFKFSRFGIEDLQTDGRLVSVFFEGFAVG